MKELEEKLEIINKILKENDQCKIDLKLKLNSLIKALPGETLLSEIYEIESINAVFAKIKTLRTIENRIIVEKNKLENQISHKKRELTNEFPFPK